MIDNRREWEILRCISHREDPEGLNMNPEELAYYTKELMFYKKTEAKGVRIQYVPVNDDDYHTWKDE